MKQVLYINHRIDGYTVEQCDPTMTVEKLIEKLSEYPSDTPVYFRNDGGYTYGSVDEDLFRIAY